MSSLSGAAKRMRAAPRFRVGQLGGGPRGDDPAPAHDDHPVGHPFRLLQLVGGEQHGDARVAQLGDLSTDGQPATRVHPGGGLVQEHHLGPADQGQGHGQPLLFAARQSAPRRGRHRPQVEPVEQIGRLERVLVVGGEQADGLGRAHTRVHPTPLQHDPHAAGQHPVVGGPVRVEAQDPDPASGRPAVPLEGFDGAGLARSVAAQQRHHLAALHHQVGAVHCGAGPVPDGQTGGLDGGLGGGDHEVRTVAPPGGDREAGRNVR